MKIAVTAFTRRGYYLAGKLRSALTAEGESCTLALPARLADALDEKSYERVSQWARERFEDCDGLLFVGACGIAVRAIAPYVRDKWRDPAVVSVDEDGRWTVPLLSGHVGGANDLARRVANLLGGTAAISTATDVNDCFAVDEWARCKGLCIDSRIAAKQVSVAILTGNCVGLQSEFTIQGKWPEGLKAGEKQVGICVTVDPERTPFPTTLRLIPPVLILGIGCRRGTTAASIERVVEKVLLEKHLAPKGVFQVSTISLKRDEPGLLEFCHKWELPLVTWTAEELREVPGDFTSSDFVANVTGVDNVCERAAVLAGGELIVPKQAEAGVTVAVARRPYVISFDKE